MRKNFEVVLKSLLYLRKFYARLGWEDKISEIDNMLLDLKHCP